MLKKSLFALAVSGLSIATALADGTNAKVAAGEWMRLTNSSRSGYCVTLVDANASDSNARLYGKEKDETADGAPSQQWKFVEDPENAGHYAMVCMASPNGSVTLLVAPSGDGTNARWGYDDNAMHYTFTLYSATTETTLVLKNTALVGADEECAMNMAMIGKKYAMNSYKVSDRTGELLVINSDDATTGLQWYAIQTQYSGSDSARQGRILGLSEETTNRLNFNVNSESYTDSQLWTFVPDPAGSGKVAIVNKTLPILSVSATPTEGSGMTAKFAINTYGYEYGFTLAETGVNTNDQQWYMLLPNGQSGQYINASASGKKFDANLYANDSYAENANHLALIPVNEGSFDVTVNYVDATGAFVKASESTTVKYGHTYNYSAPEVSYFTADALANSFTFLTGNYTATYNYTIAEGGYHGVQQVLGEIAADALTDGQSAVLKNGETETGSTPESVWNYSEGTWTNEANSETTTTEGTPYSYIADVYFKVTYTAQLGNETKQVDTFVKAGDACYAVAIEGYTHDGSALIDTTTANTTITDPVQYQQTTAISEINVDSAAAATVYDLQGRRVNRTIPGNIYIINGQKVRK
jgi:hypothetical protein